MPSSPPPTSRDVTAWMHATALVVACLVTGWLSPRDLVTAVVLDLVHSWVTRSPEVGAPPRTGDDDQDGQRD
jgi:hypothetical protein